MRRELYTKIVILKEKGNTWNDIFELLKDDITYKNFMCLKAAFHLKRRELGGKYKRTKFRDALKYVSQYLYDNRELPSPEDIADRFDIHLYRAKEVIQRFIDDRREEPIKPCKYLPGTKEKIDELRYRVANGYQLWHKQDRNHTI